MAFNFGSHTPAPAAGGFSLAGPTPAAAPTTFGATTFGAAKPAANFGAPAPSAFGGAPAPTSAFGAPAAPFGSTTPAPFGGAAPFGTAPAPFGSPAPAPFVSSFGAPPAQAATPLAAPSLAGRMRYTELPPHHQQAIDKLYSIMMQHKRTMVHMKTPLEGQEPPRRQSHQRHVAVVKRTKIQEEVAQLQKDLSRFRAHADETRNGSFRALEADQELLRHVYSYGKWSIEAVAAQQGVSLSEEKKDSDTELLRKILDMASVNVNTIQAFPSPTFWHWLHDLELRLQQAETKATGNSVSKGSDTLSFRETAERHHNDLEHTVRAIKEIKRQTKEIRHKYSVFERQTNVLEEMELEQAKREQRLNHEMQRLNLQQASTPAPVATPAPGSSFGAPSVFGSSAPAPSAFGGAFGKAPSSAFGAAPTTAFGKTPASVFGATSTSSFGSTPAPVFGVTPAPSGGAPGPFGAPPASGTTVAPTFGAAPLPQTTLPPIPQTPKKKSGSRTRSKR